MGTQNCGLLIVGLGIGVVVIGLLVWTGALSWFGRLPGDIRIDRGGVRVYFPITSMILASVVLSLLFRLFFRPR